jgi:amino acid transporter
MKKKKILTAFSLTMINIAAIGSVKNWPITAEYGLSAISYLVLAALCFFIPTALVTAELATAFPKQGGIYAWVTAAFGHRPGFVAIWLFWLMNVIWYPTILSFIAVTCAYVINPELASRPEFILGAVLICIWGATLCNLLGLRVSEWISTCGALMGTVIPGLVIIVLGSIWFFTGHPLQITTRSSSWLPHLESIGDLVFFAGILLSFTGIEMSAIHAKDVSNPQRSYPRAILTSGALIFGLTTAGVLAIASIVPAGELSLVAGALQALCAFGKAFGLGDLTPAIALCMAIGAFGSLSSWIIGSSRGLLIAAQDGDLPRSFHTLNKRGMPKTILLLQGGIVSLLSLLFILMPSISSAFWILSALVTELYLVVYLFLFAAAWRLRQIKPHVSRPYRIPGGPWGLRVICGIGSLTALFGIGIGFFPPSQIKDNTLFSFFFIATGLSVACLLPFTFLRLQRKAQS